MNRSSYYMGVSARIGKRGMSIDKDLRAARIFRRFFGGRAGWACVGRVTVGRALLLVGWC